MPPEKESRKIFKNSGRKVARKILRKQEINVQI